jgi:hypothetical protein
MERKEEAYAIDELNMPSAPALSEEELEHRLSKNPLNLVFKRIEKYGLTNTN